MTRSTVAHVNLAALQAQLPRRSSRTWRHERGRTPPGVIAVVKANAYGHGAERVALALEQAGATMLACADIEEGVALRRAGVRVPILVFGALSVSDLDGRRRTTRLTPTISSPFAAKAVRGRGRGGRHDRLPPEDRHRHEPAGVPARQPGAHAARRCSPARTCVSRACSRTSPAPTCRRARCFDDAAHALRRGAATLVDRWAAARALRHAANSAALLRDSRVWYDAVRPGLLLYGIVPPPLASTIAAARRRCR